MITKITKADLEKAYSNNTDTSEFVLKRIKFDLDMFDNDKVEMNYYTIFDDCNNYVGQGVLVFRDDRDLREFEYEEKVLNRPNHCLIKNVYIEECFRGKGYFSKLITQMEIDAKSKGFKNFILSVTDDNKLAQHIYEHLGFVRNGEEYNCSDIGKCYVYVKEINFYYSANEEI
ncbi:MAG: GNAT family N-acetyltransferase [Christensenellales bacterium]